jgi:radical SAM superfamily enzyme YgiQ (UPF0313 family)
MRTKNFGEPAFPAHRRANINIVKQVRKYKPGALTFAPEAGSQRLRDVINKNVTEQDIMATLTKAFEEGFTKIKLYFMFGLPYETDEDLWAIGDLVKRILDTFNARYQNTRALSLSVSASCFVPKPHTPFQYFPQCAKEEIEHKTDILKRAIPRRVKLSYNDASLCALEAAFARGDARLNGVIEAAYKNGCVFDAWPEHYDDKNGATLSLHAAAAGRFCAKGLCFQRSASVGFHRHRH